MRQGNLNPKVKIFRYITENSFDSYNWQILENKQKFISQIMTSKSPVRACEDVDDAVLSYAEIKALATGNVHIKEKMDLDIQVSRLKLMKANHTSQKYRLEADIARKYPVEIQAAERRLDALKGDWKAAEPIVENKDGFAMTVDGILYMERREAGMALLAACAEIRGGGSPAHVGEFQGFNLSLRFDFFNHVYLMTVSREWNYRMEMGKDPLGNLKRLQNLLSGIKEEIPKAEHKLVTLNQQMESAREEAVKPFPKEKQLAEMLERLAELNAMLSMDQSDGPEDVNEEEAEESAREELETETKDKNTQTGVEEASWTLQKIKEMRKKNVGGLKTVQPPQMIKKNNGTERM